MMEVLRPNQIENRRHRIFFNVVNCLAASSIAFSLNNLADLVVGISFPPLNLRLSMALPGLGAERTPLVVLLVYVAIIVLIAVGGLFTILRRPQSGFLWVTGMIPLCFRFRFGDFFWWPELAGPFGYFVSWGSSPSESLPFDRFFGISLFLFAVVLFATVAIVTIDNPKLWGDHPHQGEDSRVASQVPNDLEP